MEQFRDTTKSAKQAKPIQDVIAGFSWDDVALNFRHDHMHMEDGVLVEDIPPEPSVDGADLGGIALTGFNRWDDMGLWED